MAVRKLRPLAGIESKLEILRISCHRTSHLSWSARKDYDPMGRCKKPEFCNARAEAGLLLFAPI